MREVYDIVKDHRDHRDYSSKYSHAKEDFMRKYYHTRAQTQIEPMPEETDEPDETVYQPYRKNDFAALETRLWFECFLKRLNEKDRQIAKLLEMEHTQKKIGEILGYSNHSGVNKRIKIIRQEFRQFRKEDDYR